MVLRKVRWLEKLDTCAHVLGFLQIHGPMDSSQSDAKLGHSALRPTASAKPGQQNLPGALHEKKSSFGEETGMPPLPALRVLNEHRIRTGFQ